jgi:hypothetical protein
MESEIIELLRVCLLDSLLFLVSFRMSALNYVLKADQEALSTEAARYLEDGSPVHVEEFGGSIGDYGANCEDESSMLDDCAEDGTCPCPLCLSQPLFLQMGWFMCVCGLRLSVKAEPISMRQLKTVLQQSALSHQSSGCIAAPRCVLKVRCARALETSCAASFLRVYRTCLAFNSWK